MMAIRNNNIFYPSIDQQYRDGLHFVCWIKYHQSTPVQTISSEIEQSVKTVRLKAISNEVKNNLQRDSKQSRWRFKRISNEIQNNLQRDSKQTPMRFKTNSNEINR